MCSAWLAVTYAWYRVEYRVPHALRRFANAPRVLIQIGGWVVLLVVLMYSLGGIVGDVTQISQEPVRYAHRVNEAVLFWTQIVQQTAAGFLFGGGLIALGRAPFRARKLVVTHAPAE